MQIVKNIKTFLYDKNYFINVYENKIHIFNYVDLEELSDKEIVLKMESFKLYITGSNLHISKMAENELLISGTVFNMRYKR